MQTVYKTLYGFLMVGLIALGALLIVSSLPFSGLTIKIVKSGSMEPTIKTGGIVVDFPQSNYQVGDVVTFGQDTKVQIPTTHRIVAITGSGASAVYTTKGDANDAPDPVVTHVGDIHGKVLFTVPYIGYVLNFARQPLGFALLVGIPALLIIIEEVSKIVREVRVLKRKRKLATVQIPETHSYASEPPQKKKIIVN
jgi:signal peptidase